MLQEKPRQPLRTGKMTEAPSKTRAATADDKQPSHARLLVLDGLRGVAAFGVINDHVASATIRALSPGRYLAVDFFWVLSGFVLALAYDDRLKRGGQGVSFMRLRLIRFYPLYLLGLVIGGTTMLYGAIHGWGLVTWPTVAMASVFALLFVPCPPLAPGFFQHLFPLNGPTYSLFYELVVNAVYGFFAPLLSTRVLVWLVAIFGVLVAAIVPLHLPGAGWRWPDIDAGLVRLFYCFFMGVILFRLRDRIRIPALPPWVAVVVYVVIIGMPVPDAWRSWYNVAVILFAMPLLVASASRSKVSGVSARIFALMGLLSYGVYVLHVPLLGIIQLGLSHFGVQLPGVWMVAVVSIAAGALAWIANYAWDIPVRRWLTAASNRRDRRIAGEQPG